jgi:hypothetical protein
VQGVDFGYTPRHGLHACTSQISSEARSSIAIALEAAGVDIHKRKPYVVIAFSPAYNTDRSKWLENISSPKTEENSSHVFSHRLICSLARVEKGIELCNPLPLRWSLGARHCHVRREGSGSSSFVCSFVRSFVCLFVFESLEARRFPCLKRRE